MSTMAAQRGYALPFLRAYRRRAMLTQNELIEKSGVSRTTVVRAERGDESLSIANIRKLAEALGVTADQLVYEDPDAERDGREGRDG